MCTAAVRKRPAHPHSRAAGADPLPHPHNAVFGPDNHLLHPERIARIRGIPAVIVQGRYDMVCPMKSAHDLHRAWPEAEFIVVPDSGHSAFDVGIQKALLDACDRFAK